MSKTKTEVLCDYCKKYDGSYELRYNEEYKQDLWYCVSIGTWLHGLPILKTSSITTNAEDLVLPLITRTCSHTVQNDVVKWQGPGVGRMPTLGWVYPGSTRSTYGYVESSGKYWATQWAQYNWQSLAPLPAMDIQRLKLDTAFRATLPSFSSNFSIFNFIFELKDFSRLFKLTDQKWGLKEHVESNFLNWTFGWIPFANDLVNLHGAYLRVKNVWDHIKANSDDSIVNTKASSRASFSRVDDYGNQVNTWSSSLDYLLQTRYRYDVLDTSTELRSTVPDGMYAASVAQALGICANPAIVWNALPFSFIVDWFLPIADTLDRMKQDTFVPGHTVLSHDVHTKTRRTLAVSGRAALPIGDNYEVVPYSVSFSNRAYERNLNFGASQIVAGPLDGLRIGGPSGYKWFVGAVLGSHLFL